MRRVVDWERIDLYLRVLGKKKGVLEYMVGQFKVSKSALQKRRKLLELPPLPRGRRFKLELTPKEEEVLKALSEGQTHTEIASNMDVTRQSVDDVARRAKKKLTGYCERCKGLGVTECNTCKNIKGGHFHVCEGCGGDSRMVSAPVARMTTPTNAMKPKDLYGADGLPK